MSIIEKALDKVGDDAPARKARRAPDLDVDDLSHPDKDEVKVEPESRASRGSVDIIPAPTTRPAGQATTSLSTERTRRYVKLDLERLAAAGFVTPSSSGSMTAEEYRLVKRPILTTMANSEKDNANIVLVTSALPGEGKTFTAINLAISLAMEVDRSVLLVDADTERSDVSRVLGISEKGGLTDYLTGRNKKLSELLVRTNIDKLSILPAGPREQNVTELFASAETQQLVDDISHRYPDRIIVFDTSPLLATSGTSVLAQLAGQVLVVVEAVRTAQRALKEALSMLDGHRQVGILLNKSRERPRSGYRYGYYNHDE